MSIKKRIIRFFYHCLVKLDQDGKLPSITTTKNNEVFIGLAARDIEAGEIVEYADLVTNSDIMASAEDAAIKAEWE